jgi:amidase
MAKVLYMLQAGPPVPQGTDEYETKRSALLQEFSDAVPAEFYLPQSIIDQAPKDVRNIPRESGLLTDRELDITEGYDASALAKEIAEKRYTAVEVAVAVCKRAIIAHQLINCLAEWFMEEAVETAKKLDQHLEATGQTVGPLHGIPVSVKEHFPLAGHWSSLGILDTRAKHEQDCQLFAILRKAGAVFYCKTNQPQAAMALECTSFHGRTLNPINTNLSPGGSSGGEAALMAMNGSVFAVGSDVGGSIRGPAAFCGLYGFKPTSYVVPQSRTLVPAVPSEMNIYASMGPISRSLRDMDLFMSVISAAKPYLEDPSLFPIPWAPLSAASSAEPIKIGFMMHDGVITPQPPVTRALEWARTRLANVSGVEVKTFEPYKTAEGMKNLLGAYFPGGVKDIKDGIANSGEPLLALTEWAFRGGEESPVTTVSGIHGQRQERDAFRLAFAQHWQSQDVDFVVCPAFVGPACTHETGFYWNYTAFWNYLDYPGVVLPTDVKAGAKGAEPYSESPLLGEESKHVKKLWEDGDFEGAPVNIQIVARRYHDNALFHMLERVKDALQLK